MEVPAQDYKLEQLRAWLKRLGLKVSGTKEILAQRLNEVPPDVRGVAPEEDEVCEEIFCDSVANIEIDAKSTKRQLDLIKRERDLFRREVELLKKTKELSVVNANEEDGNGKSQVALSLIKDLVPEFGGKTNFEFWSSQLKSVGGMYKLDRNMMSVLQ